MTSKMDFPKDIPTEIVRKICHYHLDKTQASLRETYSRSRLVKDLNSLGAVSQYFRQQVLKVKYQRLRVDSSYLRFSLKPLVLGEEESMTCKVSMNQLSDYAIFVEMNQLTNVITQHIKTMKIDLSGTAVYALVQFCANSRLNLDSVTLARGTHELLSSVTHLRKKVVSLVESLLFIDISVSGRARSPEDELLDFLTTCNIKGVKVNVDYISQYGIERLNAFQSITNLTLSDKTGILLDKNIQEINLPLERLELHQHHQMNLLNFTCCLNTLTNFHVRTYSYYTHCEQQPVIGRNCFCILLSNLARHPHKDVPLDIPINRIHGTRKEHLVPIVNSKRQKDLELEV